MEDYTNAYNSKRCDPVQIAEKIIDHIKIANKDLNVICDFDEELIREQARLPR